MVDTYIKFIKEKVKSYYDYFISVKVNYNLERSAVYFRIAFNSYLGINLIIKRNSICTAAKLYLHGRPAFPPRPEVPYIANPTPTSYSQPDSDRIRNPIASSATHSLPDNLFHSAFAPRNQNHHVASSFAFAFAFNRYHYFQSLSFQSLSFQSLSFQSLSFQSLLFQSLFLRCWRCDVVVLVPGNECAVEEVVGERMSRYMEIFET